MVDEIITKAVGEAVSTLEQRIKELELIVDAISIDHNAQQQLQWITPLVSRKRLAQDLGCSERYLQDNTDFKMIECRIGGRVFYDREEIKIIINSKKGERKHV